jgi:pimeloyl-ACP methyl ester carboxylesterase
VNGTQLWYDERGSGEPVVFLHAGALDSRQWERQLATFSPRFHAIAFDARGYGRSPAPTEPFRPHEDLLGLLDSLEIERAALVGNSMGGAVSIDATLTAPGRVSALVAVGPGLAGFTFRAFTDEQDARGDAAWEAGRYDEVADVWLEVWAPLGVDEQLHRIVTDNVPAFEFERFIQRAEPAAVERVGQIEAPTLVLVGDTEVQGIVDISHKLAAEVPAARFELLEGADHLPNLRRPDEFDRLVLEFMDEHG